MTTTIELPRPGDVLRYVYLFARDQDQGRDEGIEERPVVVAAVRGRIFFTLAITTKAEHSRDVIAIPPEVAKIANLDLRSSVVVSEYNHFTWLGFDVRPVTSEPSYVVGRLPPRFFAKILAAIGDKARKINRD